MTNIMLNAEVNMPKLPEFWWSPELHTWNLICRYWRIELAYKHNGMRDVNILNNIRLQLPETYDIFQGDKERPANY
eukprot:3763520-Ditylum_brightwellii.AAC.1